MSEPNRTGEPKSAVERRSPQAVAVGTASRLDHADRLEDPDGSVVDDLGLDPDLLEPKDLGSVADAGAR
ncbi:hypothetical protein [Propioniciclava soli]|uniref:hypothetical protein n=1 Tax=Propioniciclava soli TaxID=2775081 RepID=UPI001E3D248B|nr:hypothetical protein [Propioniciclava soli]